MFEGLNRPGSLLNVLNPVHHLTRIAALAILIFATLCACGATAGEPAGPPYRFIKEKVESDRPRSKEKIVEPDILEPLYRFEIFKAITVTLPDDKGNLELRRTEMSAVLILELKALTPEGASGVLRFDSVKLSLPEMELFTSLDFSPQLQKEKTRLVAEAMQSALKVARWQVLIGNDGSIQLLSRTPVSFAESMKEVAMKAGWRKRWMDDLTRLVDQDMGLKPPCTDMQLLLCFSAPPADKSSMSKLQPLRSMPHFVSRQGRTAAYAFERQAPEGTGTRIPLPFYTASPAVDVTFKNVKSDASRAEFDMEKGMLDTLQEDYTATLQYNSGSTEIEQRVRVEYKVSRLAPPIVKN